MRDRTTVLVHARWDDESGSWWTDGEDVPGLCCQAKTFEELAEVVFALAPDLLIANAAVAPELPIDVTIRLVAERERAAHLTA